MQTRHIPRPYLSQLRRLLGDRRGGPAMEFAIIAPILAVCLIFVFDLGNALQQRIRLAEAVRAAGLYAFSYPTDLSNNVNSTAIAAAVASAVPDWTDLNATSVTMACYCWSRSANDTTFTTATCSTAGRTTCGASSELRRIITISASRPFSPIVMTNISTIAFSHVVRFQ